MKMSNLASKQVPKNWWKTQFGETYYNLYTPVLSKERSLKEAQFIIQSLSLAPEDKILDLACGHGRHTIEIAKRGFNIVGLDYSDFFLKKARQDARKEHAHIKFIKKDMRSLNIKNVYDVVISMYSAFGYFSDEENVDVLRRVYDALQPGGRFMIDIINAYEHVSYIKDNGFKIRDEEYKYTKKNTVDGYRLIDTDIYYESSQLDCYHRRWTKNGKSGSFHYYMKQYTLAQYKRMLEKIGFKIQNLFGDYNEYRWTKKSWRTILVCTKPAQTINIISDLKRFITLSVLSRWPKDIV